MSYIASKRHPFSGFSTVFPLHFSTALVLFRTTAHAYLVLVIA
jgi:hypothetical protein